MCNAMFRYAAYANLNSEQSIAMITSRDNQKLKFARSVRDGRETGFIFIEGARLAEEAFRSSLEIEEILIAEAFEGRDAGRSFIQGLYGRDISPVVVADRLFASIADTRAPQGIVLIAKRPGTSLDGIGRALNDGRFGIPVVVFLSEINNPSNLGAVFRTAEAAGAAGVIVSAGSADTFSPKSIRSAMGANLRLPVGENITFDEAIAWARKNGLVSTAADINGRVDYTEIDWKVPRLVIFGSEAHGLSGAEREAIDEIIKIPMESGVESLNVAVASGIVLFEARRQLAP